MRFNGTTVPTHRDDTYDTTKINRDIQTGRAVYADKDKYENDADYKASIDNYVKEGFHLIFGTPDEPSEGGESDSGGGGSVDVGYSCDADEDVLFNDTFTTEEEFPGEYSATLYECITSEHEYSSAVVVFDGVEYVFSLDDQPVRIGALFDDNTETYDWSQYPFSLDWQCGGMLAQIQGEHSCEVTLLYNESVTTSNCFHKAVRAVAKPLIVNEDHSTNILDASWDEIHRAWLTGRPVIIRWDTQSSSGIYESAVTSCRSVDGSGFNVTTDYATYTVDLNGNLVGQHV